MRFDLPALRLRSLSPPSLSPPPVSPRPDPLPGMIVGPKLQTTLVIIPARDEEATLGEVIRQLQRQGLTRIRVVDNGSRDRTPQVATQAGGEVVSEPIPGYGRACWTGLQNLPPDVDWILFCDGDGSDDLGQLLAFWAERRDHDLILGNRRGTAQGRRSLTPVQNFGNWLATRLIRWGWGYRYDDLGPLRLVRRSALEAMGMRDRGFGWTVEMQARAAELKLRVRELPVHYGPRRGGCSKISGTVKGSVQAGVIILSTLLALYGRKLRRDRLGQRLRRL